MIILKDFQDPVILKKIINSYYSELWTNKSKRGLSSDARKYLEYWSDFLLEIEIPRWNPAVSVLIEDRESFESEYFFRIYAFFWTLINKIQNAKELKKHIDQLNGEIGEIGKTREEIESQLGESMISFSKFIEKILKHKASEDEKKYFFAFYKEAVNIDLRNILLLVYFNFELPKKELVDTMPYSDSLQFVMDLFSNIWW